MRHSLAQLPLTQIMPPPLHTVPFATLVHALVEVAGTHCWQALTGFGAALG